MNSPKTLRLARKPKAPRTSVPSAPRMDQFRTLVQPLNTESAMKKIEENNTLVFIVDLKGPFNLSMVGGRVGMLIFGFGMQRTSARSPRRSRSSTTSMRSVSTPSSGASTSPGVARTLELTTLDLLAQTRREEEGVHPLVAGR